jgi:alginate O-acetyltransferase complex protein AlgI
MWLLAVAVFAACKWATWWPYRFDVRATPARHAAFLFAYAGMDAARFLLGPPSTAPQTRDWLITTARTIAGATLVWLVGGAVFPYSDFLAGWITMTGLVLLLHFGFLDLLALMWRSRGVDATPLMRSPTRAKSLADFWSNRWNSGFRDLAHDLVFTPLRRTLGPTFATAAVFLASGTVHELVISLPARGGYGRPTLYFAIQFLGLLLERSRPLRRFFSRHASLGRAFTILTIVAPLPLLFHGRFVRNVIVPFLTAIGGLS